MPPPDPAVLPGGRPADSLRSLVRRPRVLRALRRLDRLEAFGEQRIVHGNDVRVLTTADVLGALLDAIAGARRQIAVEMYTWADDPLGRRIEQALAERLRAGVVVRVLVDAFGSLGNAGPVERLRQAGAQVHWYNPLAPRLTRWVFNRRDHRKLVLVDGRVGFAGGINFATSYSADFAGDRAWWDLMVRVEGPAVREMARLFLGTWARAGGALDAAGDLLVRPRHAGKDPVQVLGQVGLRGSRALRRAFLANVELAQESIQLAYGYFVPDVGVRRALARAARRGVRVALLLPGPTDVRMARWAGRAAYERLLRSGVRIRELPHRVLHAKVAVFDDEVAAVGSANVDPRSFHLNVELVVHLFGPTATRRVGEALAEVWESAHEVTLDAWRARPWTDRALERWAMLFRSWL